MDFKYPVSSLMRILFGFCAAAFALQNVMFIKHLLNFVPSQSRAALAYIMSDQSFLTLGAALWFDFLQFFKA